MKKCIYYVLCAILLATVFSLTSCDKEEFPIDQIANEEALEASSITSDLMRRTSDNDGSFDNIVDGSSCFDIRFPYTVSINGLEITIDSAEDLKLIEELFDAVDTDDDILDIIFPITVTLADYSEVVLSNTEDLRELAARCIEGGDDDDIECLDFIYPITLYTFNPNFERTGAVTVNSDSELRRFFTGLGETELFSVDFPVSFEMYDGTKVTVESNDELREAIERAMNSCDEDDDNDYNDDDFTKERLDALLVECPWFVDEFRREGLSDSDQYVDYVLNFKEEGNIVGRDLFGNVFEGSWSTRVSENRVLLLLEFETIADFTLEWLVYEIDEDRIKLFTAGDDNRMRMERACGFEIAYCNEGFIKEILDTCRWVPSQAENNFLNGMTIDFSNQNIHVYNESNEVVDEGNWEISETTITFNSLSMELANYIGEWKVTECSEVRFKLEREGEYLVIEKECE